MVEDGNSTIIPLFASYINKRYTPKIITLDDYLAKDITLPNRVIVDCEWEGKGFLTKQMTFCDDDLTPIITIVLWDIRFPLPYIFKRFNHTTYIIPCDITTNIFDLGMRWKKLKIYMFYSPKDLTGILGEYNWKNEITNKDTTVKKLSNITGTFTINDTIISLQDTQGLFNSSLENGLELVGIDTSDNKQLSKGRDKSKMSEWMRENPNTFFEYAIGDTIQLGEAIKLRVKQLNDIINDALPHNLGNYTINTIKYSSGSLVNDIFTRWMAHEYTDIFKILLAMTASNSDKSWDDIHKLRKNLSSRGFTPQELINLSKRSKSPTTVHGLTAGGIRGLALGKADTGLFGTVVQGGRCVNEDPKSDKVYDARIDNVIDIDLSSCYGSSLRWLDFPVGLPTVFGNDIDDKITTLGEFLKKQKKELVDGKYVIYFSGELVKTRQDLIFSKYGITTDTILKKAFTGFKGDNSFDGWESEVEQAHMGGEFHLTKQEIKLGVITSDVLEVIMKVANNLEKKEMMGLAVECVVYYPKSLELSNKDWVVEMTKDLGWKMSDKDSRKHYWTKIPLEGFIGKFIDYRKQVKSQSKMKGDSEDLLQNAVKLFINTTYGCLAAPYFEMGNTVLANNITAKARVGAWMMSKSLLTVQSITDGGMFSGDCVAVLDGDKLPSLTTLANRDRYLSNRYVSTKQLISQSDKDMFIASGKGKELDKLCLQHINDFWSNYGLGLPFDIECKYGNCGDIAIYYASSDYAIKTSEGKVIVKCRGAKQSDHPKQQWLKHLLDPQKYPVPSEVYEYTELLGLNDYMRNPLLYPDTLPGEDKKQITYHKPFKNGQTFDKYKDIESFNKSIDRAVKNWEGEKGKFGLARLVTDKNYQTPTSLSRKSA